MSICTIFDLSKDIIRQLEYLSQMGIDRNSKTYILDQGR